MKHYLNYFDKINEDNSSEDLQNSQEQEIDIQDIESKTLEKRKDDRQDSSFNSESGVENEILGLKKHWLKDHGENHVHSSTHFWINHIENGMHKVLNQNLSLFDMKSSQTFFSENQNYFRPDTEITEFDKEILGKSQVELIVFFSSRESITIKL